MLGLEVIGGALGLFASRVAQSFAAALLAVVPSPTQVIAVGHDLGRALERAGLPVVVVTPTPRKRKKGTRQLRALPSALPLGDAAVDAVFVTGAAAHDLGLLTELARVVRPGGVVGYASPAAALVRKTPPPEVAASAFLHAALVDVEQKHVGSVVLTWGRVSAIRRVAVRAPAPTLDAGLTAPAAPAVGEAT